MRRVFSLLFSCAVLFACLAACLVDVGSYQLADGEKCSSSLVDLRTSNAHCGQCFHACPTGASCIDGTCQCPSGQSECHGACVAVSTDVDNCGQCGKQCRTGQ